MKTVERVPNEIRPIIHRADMPQVDTKVYAKLLVWLSQYNVNCTAGLIDPRKLYYHQDINFDRTRAIPDAVLQEPVLISNDWAIFDGNHRGYAHCVKQMLTPYVQLTVPFKYGLKLLRSFPQVQYEAAA